MNDRVVVVEPTRRRAIVERMINTGMTLDESRFTLRELASEMGLERVNDLRFGRVSTVLGTRYLAGANDERAMSYVWNDRGQSWTPVRSATKYIAAENVVEPLRAPRRRIVDRSLLWINEDLEDRMKESGASLDAQVDRYLAQYEADSKTNDSSIKEADGDDARALGDLTLDDIDLEAFVNGVVRLIENYDNLLEFRSTLLRRARNFIAKSYGSEVVDEFERIAREDHGVAAGKTEREVSDERFTAPRADRAGDGGAGGGNVGG